MKKTLVNKSKFLSFVLRHDPESIGIVLDAQGWVDVDQLVEATSKAGNAISKEALAEIVETNDKQRFHWDRSQNRIRANQGHSVSISLGLEPSIPPEVLYHGSAIRNRESILAQGLNAGARQHVHLTTEVNKAILVGARHGKPCVFEVASRALHEEGSQFYLSENGVWLTDHVPVGYVKELTITQTPSS